MDGKQVTNVLNAHLETMKSVPFLFVGSGMSRRYLGLDTWEGLLRRFSAPLGHPFEYYLSKSSKDLAQTATLMAVDYHELWWNDERFASSRGGDLSKISEIDSCLKIEISKYIISNSIKIIGDSRISSELDKLRMVTVDGIITTNWDKLLESLFPDFSAFVGQESIIASHPQGVAEIYKIHGCVSEPNSMVLTSGDYAEFDEKNPYLIAKLLTIFIEHPVVFLGYSISDKNIQALLGQLCKCLSGRYIDRLRDRLIFVVRDVDVTSVDNTVVSVGEQNLPVTIVRTDDFGCVYEALGQVRRRLPAKVLRSAKEHLYELVANNNAKGQISVVDIEKSEVYPDVELIYGIGYLGAHAQKGYTSISANDLCMDVIHGKGGFDPERIVFETLPNLVKGNRKSVPMFKYLRAVGYFDEGVRMDLDDKITRRVGVGWKDFYPPKQYHVKESEVRRLCTSVSDVVSRYKPSDAVLYIPMLGSIDAEGLRKFIVDHIGFIDPKNKFTATYFSRLICLYDWIISGPGDAINSVRA